MNVTDELANWVIRMNAICAEKDAEIKRLRSALWKLLEYNEGIRDGKGNHHPEDHIAVAKSALAQ